MRTSNSLCELIVASVGVECGGAEMSMMVGVSLLRTLPEIVRCVVPCWAPHLAFVNA